jgi:hypothetical protein
VVVATFAATAKAEAALAKATLAAFAEATFVAA